MEKLKIATAEVQEKGTVTRTVGGYRCPVIEDLVRDQKLSVTFTLQDMDREILMDGTVSGTVTMECSRCLDLFPYRIELRMQELYTAAEPEIDVEKEVCQTLVLNLPSKPLCSDDCPGLCPHCGKNLKGGPCCCTAEDCDPRWGKLQKLLKPEDKK